MSNKIKEISKGYNNKGEYVFVNEVIIDGKKLKLEIKSDRNKGETDEEYINRIFIKEKREDELKKLSKK